MADRALLKRFAALASAHKALEASSSVSLERALASEREHEDTLCRRIEARDEVLAFWRAAPQAGSLDLTLAPLFASALQEREREIEAARTGLTGARERSDSERAAAAEILARQRRIERSGVRLRKRLARRRDDDIERDNAALVRSETP